MDQNEQNPNETQELNSRFENAKGEDAQVVNEEAKKNDSESVVEESSQEGKKVTFSSELVAKSFGSNEGTFVRMMDNNIEAEVKVGDQIRIVGFSELVFEE